MRKGAVIPFLAAVAVVAAAGPVAAKITKEPWGETPGHQPVMLYTLSNGTGLTARIATYGGMLVDLDVPDRNGHVANVERGMDRLEDYFNRHASLYGSIVGRYGNRIRAGRFTLDGKTVQLPLTGGGNTVHGGPIGFDQRVWTAVTRDGRAPSLSLSYVSLDGEMNFPGTLHATVTYTLSGHDLRVDFRATTDKTTVVDLFVHPMINLKGAGGGDILDHRVQIFADRYAVMDASHMLTGDLAPVDGTVFDFRQPMAVGTHMRDPVPEISSNPKAPGYDVQYAVNGKPGVLRPAARIEEPQSGRVMEILTTQPAIGLYTVNPPGVMAGRGGQQYGPHTALVLETPHFGNSPNLPQFPSTVLRPGQVYRETTLFRFTTQ